MRFSPLDSSEDFMRRGGLRFSLSHSFRVMTSSMTSSWRNFQVCESCRRAMRIAPPAVNHRSVTASNCYSYILLTQTTKHRRAFGSHCCLRVCLSVTITSWCTDFGLGTVTVISRTSCGRKFISQCDRIKTSITDVLSCYMSSGMWNTVC